ncbi:MAG: lamin tail domain-containing protein [Candidatus Moranbacteria bacterium]|nr:lamin tail domain-containing protein [Candidatus Moranbacteria bacterium]
MKRSHLSSAFILLSCIVFNAETPQAWAVALPKVIISEIQIAGDKADDEFIELQNTTDADIDLNGWTLRKKTKNDTSALGASIIDLSMADTLSVTVPAHGYLLWANSKGIFKTATLDRFSSGNSFTNDASDPHSVALFDADGSLIDAITWGTPHPNPFAESLYYPVNPPKNTSLKRDLATDTLTPQSHPTPLNTASITEKPALSALPEADQDPSTSPAVSSGASSIRINEIFPNPSDTDEFIELFNFGTADIDLKDWSLHDASKTGRYDFKQSTVIKAQSYLTLLSDSLPFALNNTDETITLFDAQGSAVDTGSYAKSNKDVSYNFTPSGWRWSDIVTPDAINRIPDTPLSIIDIPKHIYLNVPAHFDAANADDNIRYTWNFGDGHKSRLESAVHTYDAPGNYIVTLTASGPLEDTIQTFYIKVEKFPAIKLVITGVSPNPAGADTDNEWITIKNQSKKKVDLLDWSIATGTTKKTLTNHPIEESLIIKPGKELTLTHDITAFSLPNKGGFIELRQPDKKAADTLRYAKAGGVKEDEYYQKSKHKTWAWIQETDPIADASDTAESTALLEDTKTQVQSVETANTLINAIDTLSIDELTLIKAQIEAKLQLAAIAGESPLQEDTPSEGAETAFSQTYAIPSDESLYHIQSFPEALPENQYKTVISLINQGFDPTKTIARSISDSPFLAQEDRLIPPQTESPSDMIQYLNQALHAFLQSR